MTAYQKMTPAQLAQEVQELQEQYEAYKNKGLRLDLSRGKPDGYQLDLAMPMFDLLKDKQDFLDETGFDCRNYGVLEGIPEARRLMGEILELEPDEVIVGGSSSLNLMHDCVGIGFLHGFPGGKGGWRKEETIKFLCPSPGYDRHFAVTEHFGFELVTVPMKDDGPDMDVVEEQVKDAAVKGIWCVPKYQNPMGITFSDEVVRRMANLSPAAGDFRIFWDNAYAVHDLEPGKGDKLLSLMAELKKAGKPDMALFFTSTSKISFAGAGIAAAGGSAANIAWLKKHFGLQMISGDKVNQLRHARYFKNMDGIMSHMEKQAALLRPKFDAVLDTLERELAPTGVARWTRPRGGYFIPLDVMDGCAGRTVALCKEAGVVMTGAGATFPYGNDPKDRNIRIAPTFAQTKDVEMAASLLCLCVRLACGEKLLQEAQLTEKTGA